MFISYNIHVVYVIWSLLLQVWVYLCKLGLDNKLPGHIKPRSFGYVTRYSVNNS